MAGLGNDAIKAARHNQTGMLSGDRRDDDEVLHCSSMALSFFEVRRRLAVIL
jgi:hypothetical protein